MAPKGMRVPTAAPANIGVLL